MLMLPRSRLGGHRQGRRGGGVGVDAEQAFGALPVEEGEPRYRGQVYGAEPRRVVRFEPV